jgi:hypothetical protein
MPMKGRVSKRAMLQNKGRRVVVGAPALPCFFRPTGAPLFARFLLGVSPSLSLPDGPPPGCGRWPQRAPAASREPWLPPFPPPASTTVRRSPSRAMCASSQRAAAAVCGVRLGRGESRRGISNGFLVSPVS